MQFVFTNVWLQPIVIIGSGSPMPEAGVPGVPQFDASGNHLYTTRVSGNVSGYMTGFPGSESRTLRMSFSSVPVIWESELGQEYQELGRALEEMIEVDEGDEWNIELPVYDAARYIAAELLISSFPAPRIFSHGPKSVVFNWSHANNNLYLTVSANRISALISSPERIKRRMEYSTDKLLNPSAVLASIQSAHLEQPVMVTSNAVSQPPERTG
jgi:hypothetical protein